MHARQSFRQRIRRVQYFFPLQLLLLHLKKNHLLLLFWLLLFGYITEGIGVKYGIPYLFLFPEYFGRTGFFAFAITGFALGGFITAFNLYSYTMHGYRFPFISTLARPFLKFNVNNAAIPVLFILTYLWCSAVFQHEKELMPPWRIALHLAGFVCGVLAFLGLALLYFTRTNTDIIKLLGGEPEEYRPAEPLVDIIGPAHDAPPRDRQEKRKANRWLRLAQRTEKWRVETYLTPRLRIKLARSSAHYDRELLRGVLWQNHVNGSIFEVVLVLSFLLLGAFSDLRFFAIPAGASAFLFFTMLLMIFSALYSWLQGWTVTLFLLGAIALHALSHRTVFFFHDSHAFGLDYTVPPARYDRANIAALCSDADAAQQDAEEMLETLERWRVKNEAHAPADGKPLMLLVNTSGGGQRALLWTFRCLQVADSLAGGTLMDRTALLTGSSGGLIGAAYYRQLALADAEQGTMRRYSPTLLDELSADLLNPVAFNFVTNDMFVRYRKLRDGDLRYTFDRGHAFDRRLDLMTHGLLDVRLDDMAQAEREARTPALVISPASINDGRRLVIASRPMAFLTHMVPESQLMRSGQPEAIEFQRFYKDQRAGRLKLVTALRMNATFPYITPLVTLPSEPPMRVMDAGLRDNYGYRVTLAFLHTFRDWIAENTSGVVMLQLRDTPRDIDVEATASTLFGRVVDPLGNVYDNVVRIQDQDYDLMMRQASAWMGFPMEVVDVELRRDEEERISLSWHLTALERKRVLRGLGSAHNTAAMARLGELLGGSAGSMAPAGTSAPGLAADRAPRP
ncbi:MAG: hypothetical protein KIT10_05195 [Flavobacteriales bacterium]|nr:hypothetical protein [Flavobacteriales bacterium]